MRSIKTKGVVFVVVLCLTAFTSASIISAQEQTSARTTSRDDDMNLDTQLYLILATNREVDEGKIPPALDPIMKRLRETLPFKHYSLAGTFLNRVKNNGRFEASWVVNGSPFMFPNVSTAGGGTLTPTFNTFGALVRWAPDAAGSDIVRMSEFRFGAQVPVMMGQVTPASGPAFPSAPISSIQYQTVGLRTDISMREGSPVIAGTLNVGPQGDAIVVAVSARRAN